MKSFLMRLGEIGPDQLRLAGLAALALGVGLVWLVLRG